MGVGGISFFFGLRSSGLLSTFKVLHGALFLFFFFLGGGVPQTLNPKP